MASIVGRWRGGALGLTALVALSVACNGRVIAGADEGAASEESTAGTSATGTSDDGGDESSGSEGEGPVQDVGGGPAPACTALDWGAIWPGPTQDDLRVDMLDPDTGFPAGALELHVDDASEGVMALQPWPEGATDPTGCGACARFTDTEGGIFLPEPSVSSLRLWVSGPPLSLNTVSITALELLARGNVADDLCFELGRDMAWNRRGSALCSAALDDFGDCDAVLGVAFDGATCRAVSGCDCGDNCGAIFPDLQSCASSCAGMCPDAIESVWNWSEGAPCDVAGVCVSPSQVSAVESVIGTTCGPPPSGGVCDQDALDCPLPGESLPLSAETYNFGCAAGLVPNDVIPYCLTFE